MSRKAPLVAAAISSALLASNAGATLIVNDDFYTPTTVVVTVPAPGFLGNDSTTAGGLQAQSIDITGLQGTVTAFVDGHFTFTPNVGLATNTSFAYTARDANGDTASATVTFDMVSTLPKANADAYTPNSKIFNVPAASGLLTNDTGGIGSIAAQSIDITGLQGTVTAFADGHFTFTPNTGLATDTGFSYTMRDALGRTSVATVTFDMVSTLPKANADAYTPNSKIFNVPAASGLLTNDTGGIGSIAAQSIDITGLQGTVTAFADGHFTFTPNTGLATNTGFSYTMRDEVGRTSVATVTFDLESTLPKANDDFYNILIDQTLAVGPNGILGNDVGGIGNVLAQWIDITGLQGSVTAFPDGHFFFTPTSGFFGDTSFDYAIADELGRISTATVHLHVGVGGGTSVPEPGALPLALAALGALGLLRRRRH